MDKAVNGTEGSSTDGRTSASILAQIWTAQGAGSRLASELRDALDAKPERFGRMQELTHLDVHWTGWGRAGALRRSHHQIGILAG
ncbi:hypothetical protein CLBKND_01074 [Methylorubrum aminovorans]|nr:MULTISPECIES: hypothetical protein [unclassified Methylobacterium]QIJ74155.1 hypothetical protein CLZ_05900 [Methylobacterium sp. CLZ]QIJ79059.1 hypothetical protein GU700_05900 [Methylobacterium sp. NI91]